MAAPVHGNTAGLKPSQVKALTRLYQRRYPALGGYTLEQARELGLLSSELGRQIGLLIDRQGRPRIVVVGDAHGIVIPELPPGRHGSGRLRGLRLLHTHLNQDPLNEEDLMDLIFLRLDSIAALGLDASGHPSLLSWAHLLPMETDQGPYRLIPQTSWDHVQVNFVEQAEAIEEELGRTIAAHLAAQGYASSGDRAVLISVDTLPRAEQERSLLELAELARTAGISVVNTMIQRVPRLNPKHILGKGKLAELEVLALRANAGLLLFDQDLSPTQIRNLTQLSERKVLDRTQLILDIFAQHAKTRAGKLQVEMAQLRYAMPRLIRQDRAMSRLAGGIGGRGPGETKLEMDRRKIRLRIAKIKQELDALRRRREATRTRRQKMGLPIVAMVGYTNTGKSSLLNVLTTSDVLAENKLFATLDPTSRRVRFPEDREVILTDTVGFIRRLPPELKEAFRATLEELDEADLFLHVADAAHPELEQQVRDVRAILTDMELHEIPTLLVLNKLDRLDARQREELGGMFAEGIGISVVSGEGLENLVARILATLPATVT
ncbi:GTPase HflX [Desulfonatronum thioautotrophicum]|uniref:GTPase HflX n=1 Tax=Desulfonatronum thioautotrophicum TaxID=617001 RepID=UPI00069B22C7|nr:GTPase HflX [Desulfonatronum thioautotrophicum]